MSPTGNRVKVYQPKQIANKKGRPILRAFLVELFNVNYFSKLLASFGNTNDGLNTFASSISIKA